MISCSCGRLKQSVRCGRSSLSQSSDSVSSRFLKCNNQCEIAKRNARLAEALGISDETRERANKHMAGGPIVYPEELVVFAKEDTKFVLLVEKTFAEFITSSKRSQVLPHMPQEKRKFVHSLASVYRLDAQLVDQEPLRSVQVIRRLDSRVPTPLLSTYTASIAPALPNLGRLGLSAGSSSAWRMPSKPAASPAPVLPVPAIAGSGAREWRSVVSGGAPPSTGASSAVSAVAHAALVVMDKKSVPSRSATPNVGVQTESTVVDEGNVSVPDDWEDDG